MGTMRLACLFCDRDDGDGLELVPSDWKDVDEIQSYEDSMAEAAPGEEAFVWWTHLGVCPDCQETRYRPADEESVTT